MSKCSKSYKWKSQPKHSNILPLKRHQCTDFQFQIRLSFFVPVITAAIPLPPQLSGSSWAAHTDLQWGRGPQRTGRASPLHAHLPSHTRYYLDQSPCPFPCNWSVVWDWRVEEYTKSPQTILCQVHDVMCAWEFTNSVTHSLCVLHLEGMTQNKVCIHMFTVHTHCVWHKVCIPQGHAWWSKTSKGKCSMGMNKHYAESPPPWSYNWMLYWVHRGQKKITLTRSFGMRRGS